MGETKIKETTTSWEELLHLCGSKEVVYKCQINGYPAFASTWTDNWCVVYVPDGIR